MLQMTNISGPSIKTNPVTKAISQVEKLTQAQELSHKTQKKARLLSLQE